MSGSVFTDAHEVAIRTLVALRRQRGVTQVQLAERLAKPQSFISKIEQRQRRLDLMEFCQIVMALNADPAAVLQDILRHSGLPDVYP